MADLMSLLQKMVGKGYSSLIPPPSNGGGWEQDLERYRAKGIIGPGGAPTPTPTMRPGIWDSLSVEDKKRILSYMGGTGPLSDQQVTYALQNMGGMYPTDSIYESAKIDAGRGR